MEIKRCSDCGRFLVENYFNWQNIKKNRRHSYCKTCHSNRNYLWKLDNPEYDKKWQLNNREHYNEYQKQWCVDNPKYHSEYNKLWRKKNKEHIAEYFRQRRKYNFEYYSEYKKQYRKDNKDKLCAMSAKRRALKKNQSPTLIETEKKKIYCLYKFSSILGKHFVIDHYQPISKGGPHHPDNLQILTTKLNLEKGDKWPLTEKEQIKYTGLRL